MIVDVYHPFMVKLGIVCYCYTNIALIYHVVPTESEFFRCDHILSFFEELHSETQTSRFDLSRRVPNHRPVFARWWLVYPWTRHCYHRPAGSTWRSTTAEERKKDSMDVGDANGICGVGDIPWCQIAVKHHMFGFGWQIPNPHWREVNCFYSLITKTIQLGSQGCSNSLIATSGWQVSHCIWKIWT